MEENRIYGWFDDPTQTVPSHDPPHDAPCLFCGEAIIPDDVRTHSLTPTEGYAKRSYFYRTHQKLRRQAWEPVDGRLHLRHDRAHYEGRP